ncbi:PREDICTED: pleckstrin homology domain-containing family B member 1-like, partial [Fulmarus glacialis]|uniref:pleckstrin homology domain-containing family B member 1-like n=1 Tax=Fulmarus glacialis TaxID=30455 RepID=UPI00051B03FA
KRGNEGESPSRFAAATRGKAAGSILRRWKRNWFVLYLDGSLVYYHDETQRDMDGRIHIKYSCRDVRTGHECRDVQPPEGKSRDCLLTIVLRDGSKTTLCAESKDDAV